MRPLDPLLLGSFPAPPTHIPRTPTSPNPPPSRPPSSPLPPLPAHVHVPAPTVDSLAAIDVRDILRAASAFDDESGDSRQAALPPLARALSVADPIDPQTMSSSRRTIFSPSSPPRSPSPDIPAILSATPRPRANSLHKSKFKAANLPYGAYRHPDPVPSDDDDYDARSWIDYDDFARPDEESRLSELERHLEGFDSDASDSSLDLHTPLPCVAVLFITRHLNIDTGTS